MTRSRRINGPLLTLLVLVVVEALSHTAYSLPEASPLYLTAVVYSASTGGLRPGLLSGGLVLLYAAYSCSIPYVPRQFLHMTDDNLRRFLVIAVTMPIVAVMVGRLKGSAEQGRGEEGRTG